MNIKENNYHTISVQSLYDGSEINFNEKHIWQVKCEIFQY